MRYCIRRSSSIVSRRARVYTTTIYVYVVKCTDVDDDDDDFKGSGVEASVFVSF